MPKIMISIPTTVMQYQQKLYTINISDIISTEKEIWSWEYAVIFWYNNKFVSNTIACKLDFLDIGIIEWRWPGPDY